MRVLVSSGLGPLHFIESVSALAKRSVCISIILGLAPRKHDSFLVKIASKIVGRNLSAAFDKRRQVSSFCTVKTCPLAELLHQAMSLVSRIIPLSVHFRSRIVWTFLGFETRRLINGYDIFHCRSGAGQGGAIVKAKKYGMKVLVDQSALHPYVCEKNLKDDYAKWGIPIVIAPNRGVWVNVEQDCKMADMIVVNADHIKQSFVENGYSANMIRVVYLGVRNDFFGLKRDYALRTRPRVLFTGAVSILKGAEYLLESLRILANRGVDVEYIMIGSVLVPKQLTDRYSNLPVRFVGRIPQDELKEYFKTSDIYVFPSLADGCAKAGMEAMAAGMPVIATIQSGLPIVDNESGCVVPMKNAESIANKVEWLLNHPIEREHIGRSAAQLIRQEYTWEKYAENMENVYRELLG